MAIFFQNQVMFVRSKRKRELASDYQNLQERKLRARELVEAADALVMLGLQDRQFEDWLRKRAEGVLADVEM